jgi:lysophospholipase L1-like esterase
MKFFILLFAAVLATSFSVPPKKKKIVFFGDSITQAGVNPDGYISQLKKTFEEKGLLNNYELLGAGIGGNKVYDLYLRLEDDVLSKKPDAVVIWIGVNDVWHKKSSGTGTDADKFEKFYNALIKKIREKKVQVFICTPAAIGEKWDNTNDLDPDLNKYSDIIRKIATTNNCPLVDLRQAFMDYSKENNKDNQAKGILTTDGVHLNKAGNSFVAEKMYDVLSKNYLKNTQ